MIGSNRKARQYLTHNALKERLCQPRVRFLLQFLIWMDYLSTQNLYGIETELDVMASTEVDISRRRLPDTLGLRIDMVVDLWYARQPWNGPSRQEVVERSCARAISLVEETRPLCRACAKPVALCKEQVYWWDWPPRHHYI